MFFIAAIPMRSEKAASFNEGKGIFLLSLQLGSNVRDPVVTGIYIETILP